MNIMLLINSFNLGGAEKLCYDIARNLPKTKHTVYVCSMSPISTDVEIENSMRLKSQGVEVLSLNKPSFKSRLNCILKLRKYLLKYKIDALHTNGQSPDFYGRLATVFISKCKVIVTIHSTNYYNKQIERLLSILTDQYVAVSNQTKEYMVNSLGINKSIVVIPNGIDFERYEIKNKKYNNQIYTILSVGRIMEAKNYIELALIMNKILVKQLEIRWVIVGDKDQNPDYFHRLVNAIDDKVRNRVIFTGTVLNPEKYYREADCFLLNSSYEGFGLAFIEAMASGLPVLCRKIGIIPEILNKGGSVFLLEENTLSYYLDIFMNDYARIKDKINTNYHIVRDCYSIENTSQKYLQIYKQL